MKFASVVFALIGVGGIATVDGMSIRGRGANKLMTFARRLDEDAAEENGDENNNNGENGEENGDDSMYFLKDYSIKLLSCIQGEQVVNYENGEVETSTVVFRLCPSDSCDANSTLGCESGYGDYAVGITTFLEAYMNQQEDNENYYGNTMITYNQYGQEFDAEEYMECKEYDVEENQNENQQNQQQQYNNYNGQYGNNGQQQNNYNGQYYGNNGQQQNYNGQYSNNGQQQQNNYNYYQNTQFYIGPGCSADGTSIALGMYMNEACSYPAEVDFAQISYGWESLPFSDGGLVSMDCVACYGPDEDYNYELSEMCTETYESSTSRCEENMATYSSYGPVTQGCSYIDTLVTSIYGSASATDNYFDSNSTSTTWGTISSEVSTRFMDTLSTREARAFIAAMVLFSLSACFGATLITCFCFKKRKERKRAKRAATSAKGDQLLPQADPAKKRRSSVVALVRSGTNSLRDSVTSATTGAKVVAATVAAKSVASIKGKSSKKVDAETTIKTEYKDIDIEDDVSVKSGKASVKTQKSMKSRMSNMMKSVSSKKKVDDAKSTKSEYKAPEPINSASASVKSSKSTKSKAATVAPAVAVAATAVVVKGDASVKSSKSKATSVKSSKSSKSSKYSSVVAAASAAAPVAATTATPTEEKADALGWVLGGCGGNAENITEESSVAEPVAQTPPAPEPVVAPEPTPVVTETVVAREPAPVVTETVVAPEPAPVVTESAPKPTATPEPTKEAEPVEEAAEPVTVETVKEEVELEQVTVTEPIKEEAEPVTTPEPAVTEPTPAADAAVPTEEMSATHSEQTQKTKGKKGFLSKMDNHLKKKLSSKKVTV
jgi:hypothetical protein